MIIVSDTSPITNLAAIEQIDLLHQLYNSVIIPTAVYNEMVGINKWVPGATEVQTLPWIETQKVQDRQQILPIQESEENLHLGEVEAIALALELQADLLLMDERRGRIVATRYGLPVTGLLGIFLQAKKKGFITTVKPLIDRLIEDAEFRVSATLYASILQMAGE